MVAKEPVAMMQPVMVYSNTGDLYPLSLVVDGCRPARCAFRDNDELRPKAPQAVTGADTDDRMKTMTRMKRPNALSETGTAVTISITMTKTP